MFFAPGARPNRPPHAAAILLAIALPAVAQHRAGPPTDPRIVAMGGSGRGRPVLLIGRVLLDEGGAPPGTALVEINCNGAVLVEGHTDRKGRFSLQLGAVPSRYTQISEAVQGGYDENQDEASPDMYAESGEEAVSLDGCEVRARMGGHVSEPMALSDAGVDNGNLGTIFLRRMGAVQGSVISATSLAAPKGARKALEKGVSCARKQKLDEAQANFSKAVAIYPAYAEAWCELGKAQMARQKSGPARASFEASLKADPKYLEPYIELQKILFAAREWELLAQIAERAAQLDPFDYPTTFLFHSVALYNLGRYEAAEKSARQAEKIDPKVRYPQIRRVMSLILAARGDFAAAAARMRDYLRLSPQASDTESSAAMAARFEALAAQVQPQTAAPMP